jgi:hypothetical protein
MIFVREFFDNLAFCQLSLSAFHFPLSVIHCEPVPRQMRQRDPLNPMFATTRHIVPQFVLNLAKIGGQNRLSSVFAIISLSQKGLGQAWDNAGQKCRSSHQVRAYKAQEST